MVEGAPTRATYIFPGVLFEGQCKLPILFKQLLSIKNDVYFRARRTIRTLAVTRASTYQNFQIGTEHE
jgi:hypothetical protein